MSADIDTDADASALWLSQQHQAVMAHLQLHQVPFASLPDWPEWECAPYLALWGAEDAADAGYVGYWVLAGDCSGTQSQPVPFDHLSAAEYAEPREALAAFAKRWQQMAKQAQSGHSWHGSPQLPGLSLAQQAQQLSRQAQLLAQLAADDELWSDDD